MMKRQRKKAEKRCAELLARGGEGDERAVSTLYVRFASEESVSSSQSQSQQSVKRNIVESEIRDRFYAYGEISSVRMHADKGAFVEFTTSQATQHAIAGTNKTTIAGRRIIVNWARVPKRGAVSTGPQPMVGVAGGRGGAIRPLEPPGGGRYGVGSDDAANALFAGFTTSSTLGSSHSGGGGGGGGLTMLGVPMPGGGGYTQAWCFGEGGCREEFGSVLPKCQPW